MPYDPDDNYFDDESGIEDWDDDEFFDCAMTRDGQCGKAGSEECDFECPTMLAIHRAEAQKRAKKAKR